MPKSFEVMCWPDRDGRPKACVVRPDGSRSTPVLLSTLELRWLSSLTAGIAGQEAAAWLEEPLDDLEPDWAAYAAGKAELERTAATCSEYEAGLRALARRCGV